MLADQTVEFTTYLLHVLLCYKRILGKAASERGANCGDSYNLAFESYEISKYTPVLKYNMNVAVASFPVGSKESGPHQNFR